MSDKLTQDTVNTILNILRFKKKSEEYLERVAKGDLTIFEQQRLNEEIFKARNNFAYKEWGKE